MDKRLEELKKIMSRLTPNNRKAVLARARRLMRQQNKKARPGKGRVAVNPERIQVQHQKDFTS